MNKNQKKKLSVAANQAGIMAKSLIGDKPVDLNRFDNDKHYRGCWLLALVIFYAISRKTYLFVHIQGFSEPRKGIKDRPGRKRDFDKIIMHLLSKNAKKVSRKSQSKNQSIQLEDAYQSSFEGICETLYELGFKLITGELQAKLEEDDEDVDVVKDTLNPLGKHPLMQTLIFSIAFGSNNHGSTAQRGKAQRGILANAAELFPGFKLKDEDLRGKKAKERRKEVPKVDSLTNSKADSDGFYETLLSGENPEDFIIELIDSQNTSTNKMNDFAIRKIA
jgi:hypothetical protein